MTRKKKITPTSKTVAERLQKMTAARNEIAAALLGRPGSMSTVAKQFTDELKDDSPLTRKDKAGRLVNVLYGMLADVQTWGDKL